MPEGVGFLCCLSDLPDAVFHQAGDYREAGYHQKQGAHGYVAVQKGGYRGHEDGHQGVNGGADGVTLLLCPGGDQVGIPGAEGQAIKYGDGAYRQGKAHVQPVGKGVAQNPDAHEAVNGRQQHIQADNPFLLAALVNEGCDQNGQDHVWQHATHQNEGGQQGGLGLVKDQKADGQIHGLAANGRQDCGDGDAGKILGPKTGAGAISFHKKGPPLRSLEILYHGTEAPESRSL